jgi:soluble lytic murein transglycosylase
LRPANSKQEKDDLDKLMRLGVLLVSAVITAAVGWSGIAPPLPGEPKAMPKSQRISAPVFTAPTVADAQTTGSIPATYSSIPVNANLKAGLDALSNRLPSDAIRFRDSIPAKSLDWQVLTWAIAMSGQRGIPSSEIVKAKDALAGWPGVAALDAMLERALYAESSDAGTVLKALGETVPTTVQGTIILSRALVKSGKETEARTLVNTLWRSQSMDKAAEDTILKEFAGLLTPADHRARMDYLMYRGKSDQAARFSVLGEAKSLYKAWVAVNAGRSTAPALIKAVDAKWAKDPALQFIRIMQLQKQEYYTAAAQLLAKVPHDLKSLVVPSEWWDEQRIVSRGLADNGKFQAAYSVVNNAMADDPVDIVEAEFHAGWYALRGLKDGKLAATHFTRILAASDRPLSASRAWYWLGRAAEAGGPGDAKALFAKAAAFPATFYGQLAAARLGQTHLNVKYPVPTPSDRQNFEARPAVQAIARLQDAGHGWRGDVLYRALAEQITSPGEMAMLANRAEQSGNHQLSLQIGKIAFGRGLDVAALAFPLGVIPDGTNMSVAGKALAYAIARQESSFNTGAVSPANAMGLLQILPGTAKGVAQRIGLAYSKEKLTTDAGYNATLGSQYLSEQISKFNGSYILTFIAYNAGPNRVPDWLARYGNPKGKSIDDVVDWIERIPYSETRNYVQRVMENYQVYKARLGQESDIVQDLRFGRSG